ncbi:HSP-interacting protein-like isoform X2 [Oryza brachyantha]|uniref:HSP-interacting protein-like isoform X2 n=1 Tax=Oryza brachyantha TaxID=4533 RepID=UPI0007769121|nr:HSP-interacting protein-like isoform X2 [Oryza brachyantha]
MESPPRGTETSELVPNDGESSSRNSQHNGEENPISEVSNDVLLIGQAIELKEDGTRLFQRRDYEEAAIKFGNAIKLLPKEHNDIAFLHCSAAACYMHMNPEDYEHAIDQCNLALEASPKYTNALLKRSRCFEALDRLDLACEDVQKVLSLEPNNITALELSESIRERMEETDILLEKQVVSPKEPNAILAKEKIRRKVSRKFRNSIVEEEVWEMIHEEDMQENEENIEEEKCNGNDHVQNDARLEENNTEQVQIKHNRDSDEKYREETRPNHGQCSRGASNDGQKLQHSSLNMEEMFVNLKHGQDKHQKHLKEIHVRSSHEQETHPFSSIDKRQKNIDQIQTNSHSLQEKHTEKFERYANGNREKPILGRHIGRGEDKQEKRSTTKPTHHGRDKHKKHITENHTDVNRRAMKSVKFVCGDDIRIVVIPENITLMQLMDIARYKYNPHLKSILLKFMDKEGDLVTITSSEELRWVEELDPQKPVRLYIKEVSPDREITRDLVMPTTSYNKFERNHHSMSECGSSRHGEEKNSFTDDWMVQFARLFKNHVGFDSDAYVDLRDLGMRLYYEAMEETITSEEAQEIFQAAEAKFQEMAALALYNWGNVHMSRAKKRLLLSEDSSQESILFQVKNAYEWACTEYVKAGKKFEEAVDVKPDFYEGLIALGQQQFEQAKLSWRYADACKIGMGTEVLELFNHAEDNMEKGIEMWEGIEYLRVKGLSKSKKEKMLLDKLGLNGHAKDFSADEAFEQASNMRSQLNISWGTILYERSVVEFKLGLSSWEESLTEAIEKFKTGGASLPDISVMIKNHCANEKTQEGKD